ncbi:hypothetical protein DPEC_G00337980 [Dallia pectoralis]|uniref:Uncharacterized protein n=1 Tax=Dallia pectoralis TaxID=75939 RepID=A0ACC2F4E9_DALPE|nr:hypothetical protein DPEC_G00337980 [Dallia pectoralis]
MIFFKMSKKKKEKRKSSSDDSYKQSSQKHKGSIKHSPAERKQLGSYFTEDKTERQRNKEEGGSHVTPGNSTAGYSQKQDRKFKKAFYRLGKEKTSQGSEGKSTCPDSSGKSENIADGKTADKGFSKPVSSQDTRKNNLQSAGKTPEIHGSSWRFSPQMSPSTSLSRSSTSPQNPWSLNTQSKEQRRMQLKKRRPEEKPHTQKDNSFEPSLSHEPQMSLRLSKKLRKKMRNLECMRSEAKVLKTQKEQTATKPPWFSLDNPSKQPYTSPKNSTSEKNSYKSKHRPTTQKREYPELPKASRGAGGPPSKPKQHFTFKIPKKTKLWLPPANNTVFGDDQDDCNPISPSAQVVPAGSRVSRQPGSASKYSDSKNIRSAAPNRTLPARSDTVPDPTKGSKKDSQAPVQPSSAKVKTFSCDRPTSTKNYNDLYDNDQEMQLMEELHLARSEKRLELNVVKSYGELTCMDIDLPEEGATLSKTEDPIIVMDTNIFLSHLNFVKTMRSRGLGGPLGLPTVLVPWVVLQELDSLKNGKRLSSSVAHLATPAVYYIYTSLKTQEPRLWGQSMQQASLSSHGLNAENNDDRVLQCCLQYQSLYPERAVILCTNDRNLCSKAILSGVRALSKTDLVDEVERLKTTGGNNLTPIQSPMPTPTCHYQNPVTFHGEQQNDAGKERGREEDRRKTTEQARELSRSVSLMEDCLKDVLSQVLEVEMKAVYEDLWTEIVYLKPPWTLDDLLQCFKKHWIAVFGTIFQRNKQQVVDQLYNFFSGTSIEYCSMIHALSEARKLLQAFGCRSDYGGRVPLALSSLKALRQRLQIQPVEPLEVTHTSDSDTLMAEEEEEKQTTPPMVSHQEMWVLLENVWRNIWEHSSSVFADLRFDEGTLESRQPIAGSPPSQDALCKLHKISSAIRELHQAFTRVLSTDRSLHDAQALLFFIHSSKMAAVEPRFTAKDLLDCLSQNQYKQMLCVGVNQLADLNVRLDRCAEVTSRQVAYSPWP